MQQTVTVLVSCETGSKPDSDSEEQPLSIPIWETPSQPRFNLAEQAEKAAEPYGSHSCHNWHLQLSIHPHGSDT